MFLQVAYAIIKSVSNIKQHIPLNSTTQKFPLWTVEEHHYKYLLMYLYR